MSNGRRPLIEYQPYGRGDHSHRVPPYGHGLRLDAYLAKIVGHHSRAEWQRLILAGAVLLRGRPARPADRVAAGDAVIVRPTAHHLLLTPDPSIPLEVVYADAALIVVNKPPGLVVHPAPGNQERTLVHALLARFPELHDPTGGQRPGIVHRLDKDTSGVIVAAKTDAAHQGLSKLFAAHDIERTYIALTRGAPEPKRGTVETQIGRARFDRQRMAVLKSDGREAVTHYRVQQAWGDDTSKGPRVLAARVACTLETGRTHQIRVHMAHKGAPVLGDPLYGSSPPA
ncbi:MAG TPA: RluA family pseudouridine synthase, partial [Chloroflexota bacterium]|nr:RluA family pseudouridine synthase [Chloroflexota bacterium]